MSTLLSSCCVDYCAEASIYSCGDIEIPGLEISTEYFWTLTDQFDNNYTGSGTTDTNGQLTISPDDLPAGLLTYGAGQMFISVSLTDGGEAAPFTVADTTYSCLMVTIVAPAEVDPCADVIGNYSIDVVTNDAKAMATTFSGNAVDIYFKGQASNRNYRNTLTDPYNQKLDDLGLPSLIYPSGGHIANYTNPPTGGNNTDGYGFEAGDFAGTGDDINSYGDHVGDPLYPLWNHSFATDFIALKTSIGVQADLCFNIRFGTQAEMDWWIANLDPEFIELGNELQSVLTGAEYKLKADAMISYLNTTHPGKKIILDFGLVYKTTFVTSEWNNILKTITGAGHGRYYIQVRDRVPGLSSNQEANVALLMNYKALLDADLAAFKNLVPTWKMAIVQILLEDNRQEQLPHYIDNTVVGNWLLGIIYEWILENTEDISYAAWMSLKNLINNLDVTSNNYATIKQLSPMFGAAFVGTVTFEGLDGVSGVVAWNGTQYYLLVNSSSGIEYNVPVSALNIDGIVFAGTVTRSTLYGVNWEGSVLSDTGTGETVLKILPYSNSLFGFTVV